MVTYILEDIEVEYTPITLTRVISSFFDLMDIIMVLLFLGYRILSWVPGCLGIMLCTFFDMVNYIWKLAYRFRFSLSYDAFRPFSF